MESISVSAKEDELKEVSNTVRYTLLTSNLLELTMELCLYGSLIKVSHILSDFLKSFENEKSAGKGEKMMLSQGRLIIKLGTANIIVMMITDSIYSVISPYLWLGYVFEANMFIVITNSVCTSLFYLANTFFACLLIYLTHYFGSHSVEKPKDE